MSFKLDKTYLSKPPGTGSFVVALISFLVMLGLMGQDASTMTASHHQVFVEKSYWKAFTTTLVHADLNHLFHNAFFFTGLATLLNGYFGFFAFPVLSFVAGGIANLLTLFYYPAHTTLVGVSGVVYFMAAFWLTLFIFIDRKKRLHSRIIYGIGMALIFFFPDTLKPQVSYLAHFFGFALGIPAAIIYFFMHLKQIRAAEVWIEVAPSPPPIWEDQVFEENGQEENHHSHCQR